MDSRFRAGRVGGCLRPTPTMPCDSGCDMHVHDIPVHDALSDIPAGTVAHTDARWEPVRNHFALTAFGINAYTAEHAGDRIIGEHDHADPGDERHEELYFVHAGGRASWSTVPPSTPRPGPL
jgi:hypothetical protein